MSNWTLNLNNLAKQTKNFIKLFDFSKFKINQKSNLSSSNSLFKGNLSNQFLKSNVNITGSLKGIDINNYENPNSGRKKLRRLRIKKPSKINNYEILIIKYY